MTVASPLDAVLEAGGVVVVPGIAAWLGWTAPEPDETEDSYEAFLDRISREAA